MRVSVVKVLLENQMILAPKVWFQDAGCTAFAVCCCLAAVLLSPFATCAHATGAREDISRGIACGSPLRQIAQRLDRAVSTVSREVLRHGGRFDYRVHQADDAAWGSALRPKKCLLALHPRLRDLVASKLILDWSPGADFRMAEDAVSR